MKDKALTIDERRSPEGAVMTDIILGIFRVNGRLLRAGDRMARDIGLTSARWQVLGAIEARPKTVAQIARDYELTRQGILWVVQAMVKEGLVELVKNPDHRRAKLVRMTQMGLDSWNTIAERQLVWGEELAEHFELAELKAGLSIVERLGAVLKPTNESDEE